MKKISKLLFTGALAALLCLVLTGCGKTKVEMAKYLSVRYSGYNGYATAYVDLDYAGMEGDIMTKWEGDEDGWSKLGALTAVEVTISVEPKTVENVSNGDKITVRITVDEDRAKESGYAFKDMTKTFTVEGLTDAVMLDPFAEDVFGIGRTVDVELSGVSPYGSLRISNNASYDDPIRLIRYTVDNDWDLKYGDVVTVTASLSDPGAGYALTRTEAALTLTGFDRYVSSPDELPADVLRSMADRVLQEAMSNGESSVQDGMNETWLAGNVTYDNIRVGDTALLGVIRDPSQVDGWITTSYVVLVVPVYRNVTTDSYYDPALGANTARTWENAVNYYMFTNMVIHPDGTVGYDDSYLDHRGFFTDVSAAEAMSLGTLRQSYDLVEVPIP